MRPVPKPRVPERAPFAPDGSLLSYVGYDAALVPNEPFEASVRYLATVRGRSAAHFLLENVNTGAQYPMFMTDTLHVLQTLSSDGGVYTGTWAAGKRGQNYGLRLVQAS